MLPPSLERSAAVRPDLFNWFGPVEPDRLRAWTGARHLSLPTDLLSVWEQTGGGDLFETETVLAPIGDGPSGDDAGSVNAQLRERGLPDGYFVFATGTALSTIRLQDQKYVLLDESRGYAETGEFSSFEEWFQAVLLKEYGARYGLGAP